MKIGIDCRKFYDVQQNLGAGIERYTYHFVRNLLKHDQINDYVLFFYSDISPETVHKIKGTNSRVKIVKLFRQSSKIPLWDNHIRFSHLLKCENLDNCIFPANVIPLFYNKNSILIIHDLAIYLHPDWFPEKQWFSTKILVPASIRKAKKIVAISQCTKNDLLKIFKINKDKVSVIYPGVRIKDTYLPDEITTIKNKFEIKGDYCLFLGTIEPRKNILNLIKAFSNYLFENEESKIDLVLAGNKGWKYNLVFKNLNCLNQRLINSRIKYIGKISNRERNILLKNCEAFIFPSQYEGFGFPVLEAMSLGVPVVTGNNSSLQEVANDSAILVESNDVNSIRRGIKQVLADKCLRQQLIVKGKKNSQSFTWEKTVEKFLVLINKK